MAFAWVCRLGELTEDSSVDFDNSSLRLSAICQYTMKKSFENIVKLHASLLCVSVVLGRFVGGNH